MKAYLKLAVDMELRNRIKKEAASLSEIYGIKVKVSQLIIAVLKDFISNPQKYKKFIIDL
jgi:hypothetical protein